MVFKKTLWTPKRLLWTPLKNHVLKRSIVGEFHDVTNLLPKPQHNPLNLALT